MNSSVDHQDNWSSLTAETALERFGSSGAGLSDANAVGRLAQFGLNRLIAAGMNVVTVSRRLGHGSPTVTFGGYAHLFDKGDESAAKAIDAVLGE